MAIGLEDYANAINTGFVIEYVPNQEKCYKVFFPRTIILSVVVKNNFFIASIVYEAIIGYANLIAGKVLVFDNGREFFVPATLKKDKFILYKEAPRLPYLNILWYYLFHDYIRREKTFPTNFGKIKRGNFLDGAKIAARDCGGGGRHGGEKIY